MEKEKPTAFTPLQLLIGGVVVGVAALTWGIYRYWESGHHFAGACDERASKTPSNSCEDFYSDYYPEYTCATPILQKPCDRAHVVGVCRGKAAIRWYYDGTNGRPLDEPARKKTCAEGDTWVAPDWQERGHF